MCIHIHFRASNGLFSKIRHVFVIVVFSISLFFTLSLRLPLPLSSLMRIVPFLNQLWGFIEIDFVCVCVHVCARSLFTIQYKLIMV